MLIHLLLTFFLVLFALLIFITTNPVYSVLFLILCFIASSAITILFGADFLGLLFIMVYVGAVAVLFLFVIMMIDTKSILKKSLRLKINHIYFLALILSFSFISIYIFFQKIFFNDQSADVFILYDPTPFLLSFNLTNIEIIGQVLYNQYSFCVLLAGFVLLIALIGSICLTLDLKKVRANSGSKEASRVTSFSSLFE